MRLAGIMEFPDMPSPSALLGTPGTAAMVNAINESYGSDAFYGSADDRFADISRSFIDNIIRPAQQAVVKLAGVARSLSEDNSIRAYHTVDDFRYIPPAMMMPILHHPKLIPLLQQGRIQGFGVDPDIFDGPNPYERQINAGTTDLAPFLAGHVLAEEVFFDEHFYPGVDLPLTPDEEDSIHDTWCAIDLILSTTNLDPTSIQDERG